MQGSLAAARQRPQSHAEEAEKGRESGRVAPAHRSRWPSGPHALGATDGPSHCTMPASAGEIARPSRRLAVAVVVVVVVVGEQKKSDTPVCAVLDGRRDAIFARHCLRLSFVPPPCACP